MADQSSPTLGYLALGGIGLFAATKLWGRRPRGRTGATRPSRDVAELRTRTERVAAERRLTTEQARLDRVQNRIADEAARRQRRQAADLARVDREKARLEARAQRLQGKVERTGSKRAERSVVAAEHRIDDLESMAKRIEERRVSPEELRAMMANGTLNIKRNPEDAAEQSQDFHCTPGEVLILKPSERKGLPSRVVVLGALEELTYKPDGSSCRGDDLWSHAFGDRGPGVPPTTHRPILVADPSTERIAIVRGDARFVPDKGISG